MNTSSPNPPYFDVLLGRIAAGDQETVTAFGRHVHWGIWDHPDAADGTADDYNSAAERMCRRICDAGRIEPPAVLVDVGCGFGGTIASLDERYQGLQMTGINIDARQLERAARSVGHGTGENQITWTLADAADLPLADDSCDVMLAVECIFHFDRQRFLDEAARVLRPGGRLTISDFVPDQRMVSFLANGTASASEAIRWTYGNVDMSCSLETYKSMAAETGMQLVSIEDVTEGTLPTYQYLRDGAERWHDRDHAKLFLQATGWLEKLSRKRLVRYQILSFQS